MVVCSVGNKPALKLPNLIFIHGTNQKNPNIQLLKIKKKINHNLYLNSTIKQNPDLPKLKKSTSTNKHKKNNENSNPYQA